MPSFHKNTSGGASVSGGALAPRSRRGNTLQADAYWRGGVVDTAAYESIATTTLTTSTATVTFSSIPASYKHLQIRMMARSTAALTYSTVYAAFNTDTGSNYYIHDLSGNGSSASSVGRTDTGIYLQLITGANAIASNFGVIVCDVLDYANTNKYKTILSLGGMDNNGTGTPAGEMHLRSANWRSLSAVSQIDLTSDGNFAQYSSFALYGIKG